MESSQGKLAFASISGRKVEADFDGGATTSDGGVLLLRRLEARTEIIKRITSALRDSRHPSYISHSCVGLVRQRVFQIACGYEDANDSNDLRSDPGLKVACDRLPLTGEELASQPTISRLENSVRRTDLYRIGSAFVDAFIASYKKAPKKIILDIDDTDDATHGAQQLSLFNAHYNEHCYMPLHLYEGNSGKLIVTILRPGRQAKGRLIAAILRRVLERIQAAWPKVRICLRGDSKFSSPEVHDLCEALRVEYVLGLGSNSALKKKAQPLMDEALKLDQARDPDSEIPVRLFGSFTHKAGSWRRDRRIIHKAEVTQGDPNSRFVVTNIQNRTPRFIYDKLYCARGKAEGFIKDHKTFLHSDRTSCHRFAANQFRLFLHSAAYVLLHTLRAVGLRGTGASNVYFNTLQLRFLKIGARVEELATRIRFHFPTSYPFQSLMRNLVHNLDTA
jgi:hypothetical protein